MQDFTAKRNALFACLDDASKELKGTALDQSGRDDHTMDTFRDPPPASTEMVIRNRRKANMILSPDGTLSHLRGKESIFKRPELPISRCLRPRKTPDYQINPHKWKKYSLSEVDISDHTNTYAAFEFLKQLESQQEEQGLLQESSPTDEMKIEFNKSSNIKRKIRAIEGEKEPDAEVNKPKLRGSKLIMPEYVVGQKIEKSSKQLIGAKKVKRAAGNLTLAHLKEEDEEFEET